MKGDEALYRNTLSSPFALEHPSPLTERLAAFAHPAMGTALPTFRTSSKVCPVLSLLGD